VSLHVSSAVLGKWCQFIFLKYELTPFSHTIFPHHFPIKSVRKHSTSAVPMLRMPCPVEQDETLDSLHVTVFGARGIVFDAQHVPNLVHSKT
jgi:hypothetical protein